MLTSLFARAGHNLSPACISATTFKIAFVRACIINIPIAEFIGISQRELWLII